MTESRGTYKTEKHPAKKHVIITFRVTEEEREQIRKNAFDAGCRTESEYLRLLCHLNQTAYISEAELRQLRTDVTYCKQWIAEHKDEIKAALTIIRREENHTA